MYGTALHSLHNLLLTLHNRSEYAALHDNAVMYMYIMYHVHDDVHVNIHVYMMLTNAWILHITVTKGIN